MNFIADKPSLGSGSHARELIAVVSNLVRELRGTSAHLTVTLSSRLDRDLGIDSLGRTELVLRIEREFRIRLPISVIGEAETVRDILTALEAPLSARARWIFALSLPLNRQSLRNQSSPQRKPKP